MGRAASPGRRGCLRPSPRRPGKRTRTTRRRSRCRRSARAARAVPAAAAATTNVSFGYTRVMHPWHDTYIDDATIGTAFPVIVEIPKGSTNKYELDKETGLLRLD